jgi:type I restriction enzyme S subunit
MTTEYRVSGVPFLRSQNVKMGRLDLANLKYISPEFHQRLRKSRLNAGDIVIVRTGEPGAAALIPKNSGELNCSDVVIVRPGSDVDARYLCYAINATAHQYVAAHLVGAVQQHFNVASARNLHLSIPPISMQQSIAAVLGTLDEKIVGNDRIAGKARGLSQTYFRAAVAEHDSQEVELASITEFLGRGITPRYTEDSSQLRVLNQKCIRDGRISFDPSRRTVADRVPEIKLLKPHDVLVNSTGVGTLGRLALWTKSEPCTVDSHVTIVRFDPAKTDPVCAGFGMLDTETVIEALGEGSTGQTELSRTQLAALRLVLPSSDRTTQLRPKLDALENRAESALAESLALADLRDTLLPKLMSGEIRVRDAEKVVEEAT